MSGRNSVPFSVVGGASAEPGGEDRAAAMAALQRIAENGGSAAERRAAARALETLRKPSRSKIHVRSWDERRDEIEAALVKLHRSGGTQVNVSTVLHVLDKAARFLPFNGQRMEVTQAQLAALLMQSLGMVPETVSRSFSALHAVGAVLGRERAGKSVTWEIDAEFCSRLDDVARDREIKRQASLRVKEKSEARKKAVGAAGNVTPLRDHGVIEDHRQAPLLAD